jgi:cell division protein FtsB
MGLSCATGGGIALPTIVIRIPRRNQKSKGRGVLSMAALAFLVAIGGTFLVLLGDGGFMAVMKMRSRATQLQYQINAERRANEAMFQEIRALKTDPDAIEKLAREELNMMRPDETIYLLPKEPRLQEDESARAEKNNEPGSPTAPFRPKRH